jgi:hypothetical protein
MATSPFLSKIQRKITKNIVVRAGLLLGHVGLELNKKASKSCANHN